MHGNVLIFVLHSCENDARWTHHRLGGRQQHHKTSIIQAEWKQKSIKLTKGTTSETMGVHRNTTNQWPKKHKFLVQYLLHTDNLDRVENEMFCELIQIYEKKLHKMRQHQRAAQNWICRTRKSWEELCNILSDRQFERYFRMTLPCFEYLSRKIETNVGSDCFLMRNISKSWNWARNVMENLWSMFIGCIQEVCYQERSK